MTEANEAGEVVEPGVEAPPEPEGGGAKVEGGGEFGGGSKKEPEGEPEPKPKEDKTFTQDDINRILSQDKKGYRRENETLREEVARLKGIEEGRNQTAPSEPPQEDGEPLEPNEDDFDSIGEYNAAYRKYSNDLVDYRVEQKFKERDVDLDAKTSVQKEAQRVEQAKQDFAEKAEEFAKTHEDFYEVATKPTEDGGPVISQAMFDAIRDGGLVEVAYHLGNNVEESHRIHNLPPESQKFEIARLAGRLESKVTPPAPGKTGTNAPPPPGQVKGGSAGGTPPKDTSKMTANEYYDYSKKQTAQKQAKAG